MVRKMMNNRGQAYSTFQLLIAAVIAMAILVILIPIIMQVMGIITSDPTDETKRMLSNAVDNPSAIQFTPEVAFATGDVLSAQAITERTGISKGQVCMGALDFGNEGEDDDFEVIKTDDTHRVLYHGSGSKTVKVAIVCNVNLSELTDDIEAYFPDRDYDDGVIDLDYCPDECASDRGTCCAVVILRT